MKYKLPIFSMMLIALLSSFSAYASVQVSATVSDNKVTLGDMLTLTVTINDKDDDYQLDTRALEELFTVYRPSQSQRSEYVNGKFSQQTIWQVRLQAKKTGVLKIPRLKIGDLATDPIEITVTEVSQQPQRDNDAVFIENSMDKKQIYIGQSFIFTTKLYLSQSSNELELIAPHFSGAEVSIYGKDKNSQTVRNGIRYNTITRQYKINATQTGEFTIASPLLTGTLRNVVAVSEWQNRVIAEPINVRGERLDINVKAIPDDFQGEWLVSEDLHLIEDNDLKTQRYKVGEPITRSITLQIASVDKDKLPTIKLNYPKSLRFYPDQDQLSEGQANGLNYGVRTLRHAIIADKVGTLTLPEITLNWWNSRTDQQETATLPTQEITIIAGEEQPLNSDIIAPTVTKSTPATIIVDNSTLIYWQIAVVTLLLVMLLMTYYHLAYRRLVNAQKSIKNLNIEPLTQPYVVLQSCLHKHCANKSYSALLIYAQSEVPTLKSLNQFPEKTAMNQQQKQQLTDEINTLERCCSLNTENWNGDKLASLMEIYKAKKLQKNTANTMDLNP